MIALSCGKAALGLAGKALHLGNVDRIRILLTRSNISNLAAVLFAADRYRA